MHFPTKVSIINLTSQPAERWAFIGSNGGVGYCTLCRAAAKKNPANSGTKESKKKKKEKGLKNEHCLLDNVTASTLWIIVDIQGIILTWYLPHVLSKSRQVGLFSLSNLSRQPNSLPKCNVGCTRKARLVDEPAQRSRSCHEGAVHFHLGEGHKGVVNLSPAWFQQGYKVSASVCLI